LFRPHLRLWPGHHRNFRFHSLSPVSRRFPSASWRRASRSSARVNMFRPPSVARGHCSLGRSQ
jgi:hypothetical protein